jgi:hypothetical protein
MKIYTINKTVFGNMPTPNHGLGTFAPAAVHPIYAMKQGSGSGKCSSILHSIQIKPPKVGLGCGIPPKYIKFDC